MRSAYIQGGHRITNNGILIESQQDFKFDKILRYFYETVRVSYIYIYAPTNMAPNPATHYTSIFPMYIFFAFFIFFKLAFYAPHDSDYIYS
jgi:hypothetical protein